MADVPSSTASPVLEPAGGVAPSKAGGGRRTADGYGARGEQATEERHSRIPTWLYAPDPEAVPYVKGETRLFRGMIGPAVMGAVGLLMVFWGASQPTSPFTLNHATYTTLFSAGPTLTYPLWYFGAGRPVGNVLVGVVVVYAGMFLMIRAWLSLARLTRLYTGTPVSAFVPVFIVWLLPLLVVAPIFSHDAFSYVGQGEEMTRGLNPYLYPPTALGQGSNPYSALVDQLWQNTTSPYGPVFLGIAGWIVQLVNHNELAAVLGFRLLALAGVVLLGVFTPRLARSYGLDGATAFVLVALNPLILFHLVGGEHNDAIMLGLLVAGLALARERHPIAGILLCAVAGLVKAPAFIGILYIGWDWAGVGVAWRARVAPTLAALGIGGVLTVAMTYAIGIGWGWVTALLQPGIVSSWMDPGTGVGKLIGGLVRMLGLGEHTNGIVQAAHGVGLAAAGLLAVYWLLRSDGGVSSLRAMGLTLLAVVVLGPVIQPWYLSWGIVLLAPVVTGKARLAIIWLSAVMSFLGLPGGRMLASHLEHDGVLTVLAAVAVLVGIGVLSYAPRMVHAVRVHHATAASV